MTWLYVLASVAFGVFVAAIVLRRWVHSRGWRLASDWAKETFPVWAALGPFKNGTESAIALGYAFLVVRGIEFSAKSAKALKHHVEVYDADPDTWEENRQLALQNSTYDVSTYVEKALQLRDGTANRDDEVTMVAAYIKELVTSNSDKNFNYFSKGNSK